MGGGNAYKSKILFTTAFRRCAGLRGRLGFSHIARGRPISGVDGKYQFDDVLTAPIPREARFQDSQKLALVLGLSKFSQIPEYLAILKNKHAKDGLKVLVVLPPDSPNGLTQFTASLGVPWVVDKDGQFQSLLRFSAAHRHDAMLIYDETYHVKFHVLGTPENDMVRQLVEKYLLGEITYSPTDLLASNLVGKRIEGLQCFKDQAPVKGVFVIFPPGCSSCELRGYREFLKRAHENYPLPGGSHEDWTFVFVNGRDAHTLASAQDVGFPLRDVCGVREDKLLDPYQTRKNAATVPILIHADENGLITDVRNLTTLVSGGVE